MTLNITVKFLWRAILIPSCHLGFLQPRSIYLRQSVWTSLVTKLTYWWPSIMNCVHFFPAFLNGDSILTKTGILWFSWEHFLVILCQSWNPFLLKTSLPGFCSLLKPMILNHGRTMKSSGEAWQNNDVDAWIHHRSNKLESLELECRLLEIKNPLDNASEHPEIRTVIWNIHVP